MSSGSASWDVPLTRAFLDECIQQVIDKERNGASFTARGWERIGATFSARTGKNFTKKQFKNKLDNLKKEWRLWDKLLLKETGIGIDWANNVVRADPEWWERKIAENPDYQKFRDKGLPFGNELRMLFDGVVSSGAKKYAPSSTRQPPPVAYTDMEDGYRPQMDFSPQPDDMQEGSGDSEDDSFGAVSLGTTGVSDDMNAFSLGRHPSSTGPSGSSGGSKRNRQAEMDARRKGKRPAARRIADTVETILSKADDRAEFVKKACGADIPSSDDVMAEIFAMEEFAEDVDFLTHIAFVMMDEPAWGMYRSVRRNRDVLVSFLKQAVYERKRRLL